MEKNTTQQPQIPLTKRLITGSLMSYLVQGFSLVTGLFVVRLVSNFLGPDLLGIWLFATGISGYIGLFCHNGEQGLIRFIAEYYTIGDIPGQRRMMGAGFIVMSVIGMIFTGGALVLAFFFLDRFQFPREHFADARFIIVVIGVICLLQSWRVPFSAALSSQQRVDIRQAAGLLNLIIYPAGIIIIVYLGYGLRSMSIVLLASDLIGIIFLIVLNLKLQPQIFIRKGWCPQLNDVYKVLSFNWVLFVFGLSGILLFQIDTFIIGLLLSSQMVAIYGVCQKLYNLPMMLSQNLALPLMPAAVYLNTKGEQQKLPLLYLRATKYSIIILCSISLPLLIYAKPILMHWLGHIYADKGGIVLQILLLHQWFNINHTAGFHILRGMGKLRVMTLYGWICAIFNLVLSLALIKTLKIIGVALGTSIPFWCLEAFILTYILRTLGINWKIYLRYVVIRTYVPALFILTLGFIFAPNENIALGSTIIGVIGITCLSLLLFAIFGLDNADRYFVKNGLKRFYRKIAIVWKPTR